MAAQPIQAIPTSYKGHTFRSKLEARWAKTLDGLSVPWEYEPEARMTEFGGYLPDFYLPRMKGGTWLEIKPAESAGLEDPRWPAFTAAQRRKPLVVAFGLPDAYGDDKDLDHQPGICSKVFPSGDIDHGYRFTMCAVCGEAGFEFEGRVARACPDRLRCYGRETADKAINHHDQRIIEAVLVARNSFSWRSPKETGRTLTDTQVAVWAGRCVDETLDGKSVSKWLDDAGFTNPADREAVSLEWGRRQDD